MTTNTTHQAPRGQRRKAESGATGGSAVGAGVTYQINCAIVLALEKISEVLAEPIEERHLTIEPRVISGGLVTRWDISIDHPEAVIEVKLNPARADVLEWLDRINQGSAQSGERQFRLMYGHGGSALIRLIDRLRAIAVEAGGDRDKLDALTAPLQETRDTKEVFARLTLGPEIILRHIALHPIDDASLQREIRLELGFLVESGAPQALYDLLFRQFQTAMAERKTYRISDLIACANSSGITFRPVRPLGARELPSILRAAFFVLQTCKSGLPVELLAAAVDLPGDELLRSLNPYIERCVVANDHGMLRLSSLLSSIQHEDGASLLARAFEHVLSFIAQHNGSEAQRSQIPNVIALAKACENAVPERVCRLFLILDKSLKQLGNKRLVLEVAEMAIENSRRASPRTRETAEAEAHGLICGTSWVYQRIGRPAEAQVDAEKSLRIGVDIKWGRNTAYCKKCIGRLYRMQAEASRVREEARNWFAKSENFLNDAIQRFTELTEFGAQHSEVGDCYSLLGRTYLAAGNLAAADDAVREAHGRLTDESSKDYLDLLILIGDICAARGNFTEANAFYSEALSVATQEDATRSEIAARGHLRRGLARVTLNDPAASSDFEVAAQIWHELEEDEPAAEAQWNAMILSSSLPEEIIESVRLESFSVRVEVGNLFQERMTNLPNNFRGRRTGPSRGYVGRLIDQARENVAVRRREW